MKILVTGLASLQWGRLEYGNNGNYYLIAPIFHHLHRVYPKAEIVTTFQLTDEFKKKAAVTSLPLSQYFSWRSDDEDLKEALQEYAIAELYSKTGDIIYKTPFIETLLETDLLLSFNGDMWGDNRDSTGANRFLVDLLKNSVAQKLGVPTVLFASSPGPINDLEMRRIAKDIYSKFASVINRESVSKEIFASYGYDISNTYNRACPAWLFSKDMYPEVVKTEELKITENIPLNDDIVGIIVTTNSLPGGSFSDWERPDEDFMHLALLVEYAVNENNETIVLFSHSDGFKLEPSFHRVHWRDYKMVCQLYDVVEKRGLIDMSKVHKIDGIYPPWVIHDFIGCLKKLISGKMHGAVAGMEQFVPTLAIDFQNGPVAHKMQGMFAMVDMLEYIVPRGTTDVVSYYRKLCNNESVVRETLNVKIPEVQAIAENTFDILIDIMREAKFDERGL